MKTALFAIAAAMLAAPTPAFASSEPLIGEVMLFAGNFCPEGWADADGRLMDIRSNPALYSILNDSYGGDGRTSFALPDLRKAIPAAVTDKEKRLRYCIAIRGDYPRRP